MIYSFILPQGDAFVAASLAYEAVKTDWDSIFVLEPVWSTNAWV